jgi:hypothetical protein
MGSGRFVLRCGGHDSTCTRRSAALLHRPWRIRSARLAQEAEGASDLIGLDCLGLKPTCTLRPSGVICKAGAWTQVALEKQLGPTQREGAMAHIAPTYRIIYYSRAWLWPFCSPLSH